MKSLLLAGLLLTTCPILAQTAPAPTVGTIEALDAKNGFRGYKFGTPLGELPQLEKRHKYYVDPLELRIVNGADLDNLRFYFTDGKLSTVYMTSATTLQPNPLFSYFTKEYGPPTTLNDSQWQWAGQKVTVTYTQVTVTANFGYVGVPVKSCVVTIDTNEALARRQAGAKKGPVLMGTGL